MKYVRNLHNVDNRVSSVSPQIVKQHRIYVGKDTGFVLSSPYKRAIDTVRGFAEPKDINVEVMDEFKERRVRGVLRLGSIICLRVERKKTMNHDLCVKMEEEILNIRVGAIIMKK